MKYSFLVIVIIAGFFMTAKCFAVECRYSRKVEDRGSAKIVACGDTYCTNIAVCSPGTDAQFDKFITCKSKTSESGTRICPSATDCYAQSESLAKVAKFDPSNLPPPKEVQDKVKVNEGGANAR